VQLNTYTTEMIKKKNKLKSMFIWLIENLELHRKLIFWHRETVIWETIIQISYVL